MARKRCLRYVISARCSECQSEEIQPSAGKRQNKGQAASKPIASGGEGNWRARLCPRSDGYRSDRWVVVRKSPASWIWREERIDNPWLMT
ncbi:hypothetical protein VTN96DRAFT_5820 [Rasamsonia emersonii]